MKNFSRRTSAKEVRVGRKRDYLEAQAHFPIATLGLESSETCRTVKCCSQTADLNWWQSIPLLIVQLLGGVGPSHDAGLGTKEGQSKLQA